MRFKPKIRSNHVTKPTAFGEGQSDSAGDSGGESTSRTRRENFRTRKERLQDKERESER